MLDELQHDLVVEPKSRALTSIGRRRAAGTLLLALACACMLAIAALPPQQISSGTLALGASSIALLLAGGWLIDSAWKADLGEHHGRIASDAQDSLDQFMAEPSYVIGRRQRQFGVSMLVLAAFCICVAIAPIPGKVRIDLVMWVGFSVALICIGAFHIHRASMALRRAQQLSDIARRKKSAKAGTHLLPLP